MKSIIENKTLKVIAIDPSGAVRQLLTEVLRSLGYENVQGVASVKDALGIMEVEAVDWLISPLQKDDDINGLHLLDIIINHQQLKHCRVTFLLEEDELSVLPQAIERGLLNWIIKPLNKDSLAESLKDLLSRLERSGSSEVKIAFEQFDAYLGSDNQHEQRIQLAKELLQYFTGEPLILESLIDAYDKSGKSDEAKSMLRFLNAIDESRIKKHQELIEKLFGEDGFAAADGEQKINILDLEQVIVIDPDDSARQNIVDWLTELGATNVHDFSDGESAWNHLKDQTDLSAIITEWRVPTLTGPLLVQRIRQQFPALPIIIQSDLIEGQDKPLVYEMGVAKVIEKQYDKSAFISELISTFQQERLPSNMETLERKIRLALQANKVQEAKTLSVKYYGDDSIPPQRKSKIKAEMAYHEENYAEAKEHATTALQSTTDSIMLLNLLGKIMLKTNDHIAALKCFEKVQELSPMNLARLCQIAEVQSELGESADARASIENAEAQDEDSETVKSSSAKVEMNLGDSQAAKAIMAKMESLSDVISYMNNKAVTHAKMGDISESVELYNRTFDSIPDDKADIKGIVKYNLGLAMIRQHEYPEALKAMNESIKVGESRVFSKAKNFKKLIEKAIDSGIEINLPSSKSDQPKPAQPQVSEELGSPEGSNTQAGNEPPSTDETIDSVTTSAGSFVLYKFYKASESVDELSRSLLSKKPPRFKARESIKRERAIPHSEAG